MSRRWIAVAVLSALAVLGGAVAPLAYGALVDTSAKDRIEADPPPTLFADADIAGTGKSIDAQHARAHRLMARWWATHDATPDDTAFVDWAEANLPGPPTASERASEVSDVQAIFPRRTDQGVAAATWLEAYGKKDVWKLAAHDQAELLPAADGDTLKNDVDDTLKLAKDIADALGTKYQQSAPYVLKPYLRPDHTVVDGQVCPCSYPSRHAAAGAAASTFLSFTSPHRADDYRWWLDEISWSRVYMAGHVPSDITGGALLGDMIGEYVLVTRGEMPEPTA